MFAGEKHKFVIRGIARYSLTFTSIHAGRYKIIFYTESIDFRGYID